MLGGGAGHISDMIARNKANQELRKHKSRFRKDFFKFDHEIAASGQNKIYQDEPLTKHRKVQIKNQVLADQKKEKDKLVLVFAASLATVIGIVVYFMSFSF